MTKLMALVSIITLMVLCMKVTGEMIFNMVKEKRAGQTDLSMKDSTWLERNMVWDSIPGMMEVDIMENGLKIRLKDLVLTVGWMEDSIKDNGLTIIWMVWVFIHGLMVDATWENTRMIRNTDMESINGLMEDSILDNG